MQTNGIVSRKLILSALAVFLTLSVADLFLTHRLVAFSHGVASESNPLAGMVLQSHGWLGLAIFKFTLMAAIGAMVLCIFNRRPRSAEMVMIFGCGAQAAIVLTSLFHLGGREIVDPEAEMSTKQIGNPSILPVGSMAVLLQPAVQNELQMSPRQVAAAKELFEQRLQLSARTREGRLNSLEADFQLLWINEAVLVNELTETQILRLKQLCWQHRGALAFGDADVGKALVLSLEQLDVIQTAFRQAAPGFAENALPHDDRLKHQLNAVLNPEQRGKWQAMLGAPFEFNLPAGPDVSASNVAEEEDETP